MKPQTNPFVFVFFCIVGIFFAYVPSFSAGPLTLARASKFSVQSKDLFFAENKGQLADKNQNLIPDVKFYGKSRGTYVYFRPGMISFVFTKKIDGQNQISEAGGRVVPNELVQDFEKKNSKLSTKLVSNRIDLILKKSNTSASITGSDQLQFYENFYLGYTPEQGITDVHTFSTVTYHNIYPDIDMVVHTRASGIKYEFVIFPGGKVGDIQMQWNGLQNMGITDEGEIKYCFASGNMKESRPFSLQDSNKIESHFVKKKNTIHFKVSSYNHNKPLVIDPEIIWATYDYGPDRGGAIGIFGIYYSDLESDIATDSSGNLYLIGTAFESGLATRGAFDTISNAASAILQKFDSSGKLQWATYYCGTSNPTTGGQPNEQGEGIITDRQGNIYVSGYTSSYSGLATAGAYQTLNAGSYANAFVAKFNPVGRRVWGTYFGGQSYANGTGIAGDSKGNIFVAGITSGTTGIASPGAYQTNPGFNTYKNFLTKFDTGGSFIWGTYFGGIDNEFCYRTGPQYLVSKVAADSFGNVYLTGQTASYHGIATKGAFETRYSGSPGYYEGYVARFDTNDSLKWGTYYGGPSTVAMMNIAADGYGNAYVTGISNYESTTDLATKRAYQDSSSSIYSSYIAKFDSSGMRKWGTYYGGHSPGDTSYDVTYGLTTDSVGNVYITGYTSSSSGIATKGALQTSLSGSPDAFLAVFNDTGGRKFATYYGGSGFDLGLRLAPDRFGNIYMAGASIGGTGIATKGAYSTSFVGVDEQFLAKLNLNFDNDAGIDSILVPKGKFCSQNDSMIVRLKNYGNKVLDSVRILCSINGKLQKPYYWKGKLKHDSVAIVNIGSYFYPPGIYKTIVRSSMPNGKTDYWTDNDSALARDTILVSPAAINTKNKSICIRTTDTIGDIVTLGNTYSWVSYPTGFTSTKSRVVVKPDTTTSYYLTETINLSGCSRIDTVKVTVNVLPATGISPAQAICIGGSVNLISITKHHYGYSWTSNPWGFMSKSDSPQVSPVSTTTYYLKVIDSATGCHAGDSVKITVNPKPVAGFSFTNFCPGDSTVFTDTSITASSYLWKFGDHQNSVLANPKHLYSNNGSYSVDLKVKNTFGCSDSTSGKVLISPCVWPGDANNDKIVDMNDLLAIGIAYGTIGHPRPSASINWTGQVSSDWDSAFATAVNYKHADCNGDSIIDYKDTLAISANYSKSHSKSSPLNQGSPGDPPFSIKYSKDTFYEGDTLEAKIILGTSANLVKGLYGLKFSISANPLLLETDKATLNVNSSFLGTPQNQVISMNIYDPANSQIDIGLTRINQSDASGFDNVVMLNIPIKSTLPAKYNLSALSISNNLQINYHEKNVPLFFTSDSFVIAQQNTSIENSENNKLSNIGLFPNPFSNSTTLEYNIAGPSNIKIALFDITGRQLVIISNGNQLSGKHQVEINADKYGLKSGIYLLKFMTEDGFVNRQIVKF